MKRIINEIKEIWVAYLLVVLGALATILTFIL